MDRLSHVHVTRNYLRHRYRTRLITCCVIILLAASVVATYAGAFGPCGDDWSRFDHRTFRVIGINSGESLQLALSKQRTETVKLLGIFADDSRSLQWLQERALGNNVTLLMQSPQTRDSSGRLLGFVFIDHSDLSVELVKAGLAYADRRGTTIMDGLIDPAEAEARKKKRGLWADLKPDQMPQWRKDWLRSLPVRMP